MTNSIPTWRRRKGLKSIGLTDAPLFARTHGDEAINARVTSTPWKDGAGAGAFPIGAFNDMVCRACGYVEHSPKCMRHPSNAGPFVPRVDGYELHCGKCDAIAGFQRVDDFHCAVACDECGALHGQAAFSKALERANRGDRDALERAGGGANSVMRGDAAKKPRTVSEIIADAMDGSVERLSQCGGCDVLSISYKISNDLATVHFCAMVVPSGVVCDATQLRADVEWLDLLNGQDPAGVIVGAILGEIRRVQEVDKAVAFLAPKLEAETVPLLRGQPYDGYGKHFIEALRHEQRVGMQRAKWQAEGMVAAARGMRG